MNDLKVNEPLILLEVGKAISERRDLQNAVECCWTFAPQRQRASQPESAWNFELVLAKKEGKIVGAFRPIPGSWRQGNDFRWSFRSEFAVDVWDHYVGAIVPEQYRNRAPFQYLKP